ncbi:M20A subfamily peptidase [Streptococcus australis]|uniref:Putative dipeptidase n=1 Tax=Streptococcus australis ATCC 700641 TaxID=888833 RepID=E7SCD0_9STRE|nr:dipeptidase [Streptococcus australis]EFV98856.1 putative dipeptidase [Streptococcus australis ATCC 700641]EGU69419.1 putative dipeptidase [Streptococcus australis ATCC 700641]SQH66050.1 M20A subfamily peptidase [Streptococcus australis]
MKNRIKDDVKEQFLTSLQTIISYPSVLNEGENGTPFGQAIQDVLEKTLEIAQEMGFQTYLDPEGYYGYAEIGQGEELLAVLCHLDVVPAGDLEDWQTPPFEATLKDGWLIGRGVQDDKGPSLAALYAVKSLLDQGVTFTKRIRFIFGTDEETLWRCMNRYNQIEEKADLGFAPDSSFPLTYAEKGLLQVKLHGPGWEDRPLQAGRALNVVPDKATYKGERLEELLPVIEQSGVNYTEETGAVTVLGLSKHSKDAAEGVNAIVGLAESLSLIQPHPALLFIADAVGEDATGAALFGEIKDEPSGALSFNIATLSIDEQQSEIGIDIRIPVLADKDALVERLTEVASSYQLQYEEFDYVAPLYVPLDSPLVSTLMKVYQEETGDQTPAMSSGGATFARTMENCVAYGALFPDALQTEHQANERAKLDDLYRAMEIYAETIRRLAGKEV